MTLEKLEQIIYMKSEIAVLGDRLKKASEHEFVSDSVKDYRSGFGIPIVISGYALPNRKKVERLRRKIEERVANLAESILEAEEYIATVVDSKIRTLLTLRFLEGCEWREVAKRTSKRMTADSARMTVTRFFENL